MITHIFKFQDPKLQKEAYTQIILQLLKNSQKNKGASN